MTFLALAAGFVSLPTAGQFAWADDRPAHAGSTPVVFDIPAQPLASAVEAYSAVTGIVAAYNGRLAIGRVSRTVKGRFTPEEALRILLSPDGLAVRYTTREAFVLVPALQPQTVDSPLAIAYAALSRQSASERLYSGLIQSEVNHSLCTVAGAQPGAYRIAIRFWIDPTGAVQHPRLLGSTGDRQRDGAIAAALTQVSVGASPPAGMAQPFTMIILPRSAGVVVGCSPKGRQNG